MPAPAPFPLVKRQLLISDFDESFADADTDRWTFECLSLPLRRKFQDIGESGTMQFTDMCAMLLRELHSQGVDAQEIINVQRKLYLHPAMIRGVKALKSSQSPTETEAFLLSNSNSVYLQTVLEVSKDCKQFFFLIQHMLTLSVVRHEIVGKRIISTRI